MKQTNRNFIIALILINITMFVLGNYVGNLIFCN